MKRRFVRATMVAATAFVLASSFTIAGSAQASTTADDSSIPQQFCAIYMDKTASEQLVAKDESCSTRSMRDATAGLPLRSASGTKLMTWYQDDQFRGITADIWGNYGTCDGAGYGFTPSSWWQQNMSSLHAYGNCSDVRLTNRQKSQSQEWLDWGGNGSQVLNFGLTYNDNVGYVKIWQFQW